MNERFWNLQKEKQDRMINAALKVFAGNGYYRACTDEIVREAQISKGLLFHYFINKSGLFDFICDYSIRYMKLELSGLVNDKEENFWKHCKEIEAVKTKIMGNYPYMPMFLERACLEPEAMVGAEAVSKLYGYHAFIEQVYGGTVECGIYGTIARYLAQGAMKQYLLQEKNDPGCYYAEVSALYDTMILLSGKEKTEGKEAD